MGSLMRGLLFLLLLKTSESLQLAVQTDQFSTVTLSTSLPLDQCSVCKVKDQVEADCTTSMKIEPSTDVTVHFNCSEPERSISVLTESRIECTKTACTPEQADVPASFLSGFDRKLVWKLSAPAETTLVVDFKGEGLKKVAEGVKCADGYSYSVATSGADGVAQTQPYCRNGSVAHIELPNHATVTLLVSEQEKLDLNLFTVKPKPLQKAGRTVTVIPDPDTIVIISRAPEGPDCNVCLGEGPSRTCGSKQTLSEPQTTTVEFSCPNPQDIFTVEVNRDLDCSKSCKYDTIHPEASFFPNFNRTFTWDLKVASTKAFQLDFPAPGMKQISSSEHCPDKHTYSVIMYSRAGTVNIGTFCRSGAISRLQVLYKGRVSLVVPKDTTLISPDFKYSETSGSVSAAVVDATLPRGDSQTDFISATEFPSDSTVSWNFIVPPLHNFTVKFLENILPECLSKVVKVTYQQDNKAPFEKTLIENQPTNYQGNFSLSLTNCNVLKARNAPPLFLRYRVSVFRGGLPYRCTVDLQNDPGLSLQIENTNLGSLCEFSMDSVVQKKISVPPGSKAELSFLDCPSNELLLTATKTIDCQDLSSCSVASNLLTIPPLDSCLPTPLHHFNWDLRVSEQGSVELSSPQGNLQQSLPGQACPSSVSLLVSEADGSSIGNFCSTGSQGTIQKIQVSSNVTITALADESKARSRMKGPFFNVSFGSKIKEQLIYSVSPLVSSPVLLATPNWPGAMKSDSTASWIVTIPEEYSAELLFINISQPSCVQGHTRVGIQEMGSQKEEGFREDEAVDKFNVGSSFYLNMSNCDTQHNHFAVLSKISLQKKTRKVLGIILAVVGALLAIMVIILAVVCVVVRKKKRQSNRSSIYIPKGTVSLPGDASFYPSKTRADNESHVYASIDDTMIYGHLLEGDGQTDREPSNFNGHQVGTYRTFTGPMDGKEPGSEPDGGQGLDKDAYRPFLAETFMPSRPRTPLGPVVSMAFEDRRMVDNELYTFKNTGDPNPIRLSLEDPLPPPEPETSSWSGSDEPDSHYDMAM